VIVNDNGQPWPNDGPRLIKDRDVQRGMVGLPDFVRPCGLPAMQQFEAMRIGFGAFMGEHR
jgi:hypothetical protein